MISMKLFRDRKAIGILSILVALGIVFISYQSNHSTIQVIRAKEDIAAGTQISSSMIEAVSVGRQHLPTGVYTKESQVVNKYASVNITAQDDITPVKVSSTAGIYNLAEGQALLSVPVKNLADALSGKLQAGDVVTVYFPPESQSAFSSESTQSTGQAQSPPELEYVQVAAVTASNGSDTDAAVIGKQASSGSTNSDLPATVTLIVNARQAQILTTQENNNIYFALACHGGGQRAQQLLQLQANYFVQNSATSDSSSQAATSSMPSPSSSLPSPSQENAPSNATSSTPSIDWGVTK